MWTVTIRVGINGLGRIGRGFLRRSLNDSGLEVVAVNDIAPPDVLAHLLRHDSLYGASDRPIAAEPEALVAGGRRIPWSGRSAPADIPWRAAGADYVIEATGRFARRADAAGHLAAGARRVIVSAPSADADLTVCVGVNDGAYEPGRHHVVSNASCTTNAMAVLLAVAEREWGIENAAMTTVHCVTNNQVLMDAPHEDLRRGRAALLSMVPTTTSAAEAVIAVIPALRGRLRALAVRVPTSAVSLIDLTLLLKTGTTAAAANATYRAAADGPLREVLGWCDEPLVSIDFLADTRSAVIDGPLFTLDSDRWLKILAWYDNERGYVQRLSDLVRIMARRDDGAGRNRP